MESLMQGRLSDGDDDNDDFFEPDYERDEEDEKGKSRNTEPQHSDDEDASHTNLLETIGESLGSRFKLGERGGRRTTKIVEYQSLNSDDRGSLPSFRGVKSLRKTTKKKKTKKDEDEVDEQALFDEVYDDPSMTKPVFEKAKRTALYENAKKDVSKWNSVVYHNRVAEQIVYPLNNDGKISKRSIKDATSEFVPQTPLEEEMAKVLYGEEYVKRQKNQLHSNGEDRTVEESYMLSIEEALEKHSELARLRAVQSYEMAKAKRRNKIKSKKYHRLLRREKIKKQLKEFEDLKQTDPEAALEKLDVLEKSRIRERMTLKHRNTSKWAKMQSARAKYNKDSRIALSEQLKISKDLTQKNVESSDDDDDSSDEEIMEEEKRSSNREMNDVQDYNINPNDINLETIGRPKSKNSFDLASIRSYSSPTTVTKSVEPIAPVKSKILDTKSFVVVNNSKAKLPTEAVAAHKEFLEIEDQEDEETSYDDQKAVIAEAFEDDDVVADFNKRKAEEIEAAQPKDVNLTLPGWGKWSGKDVVNKPTKEKRNFKRKVPYQKTQKVDRLPHVIINEKVKGMLRDHQVRQLPFPFNRVKDYEKIIRAPIGRTWLPETAMKTMIAPKVITKLGSVIKPINEDMLAKKKPAKPVSFKLADVGKKFKK